MLGLDLCESESGVPDLMPCAAAQQERALAVSLELSCPPLVLLFCHWILPLFTRAIIAMISLFPMAQVCPGGCDPPACSGRATHRTPSHCSKMTSWWPTQEPGQIHSFRSFCSGCVLHPQPHPQPPWPVGKGSYSQRELQPSPHTPGRGWEKKTVGGIRVGFSILSPDEPN